MEGHEMKDQSQNLRRTRDMLLPPLFAVQVKLDVSLGIQQTSGAVQPA